MYVITLFKLPFRNDANINAEDASQLIDLEPAINKGERECPTCVGFYSPVEFSTEQVQVIVFITSLALILYIPKFVPDSCVLSEPAAQGKLSYQILKDQSVLEAELNPSTMHMSLSSSPFAPSNVQLYQHPFTPPGKMWRT